jgi:hypothetical protein
VKARSSALTFNAEVRRSSLLTFTEFGAIFIFKQGLYTCTDETASPKISMTHNDAISFVNHEGCSLPTYYDKLILSLSPEE